MSSPDTWSVPELASIPNLTYDELAEHIRLARVNPGHYHEVWEFLKTELENRSPLKYYKCMKCAHTVYEQTQIRAPQGSLSSFFGVETAEYKAVVCARCKFTEFYEGSVPVGEQALNALFGN